MTYPPETAAYNRLEAHVEFLVERMVAAEQHEFVRPNAVIVYFPWGLVATGLAVLSVAFFLADGWDRWLALVPGAAAAAILMWFSISLVERYDHHYAALAQRRAVAREARRKRESASPAPIAVPDPVDLTKAHERDPALGATSAHVDS